MVSAKSGLRLRKTVSANVRKERLRKGLSQEALAASSGLHRTYIGSIERGERNVSIDNIEKIANALSVNPADLLKERRS